MYLMKRISRWKKLYNVWTGNATGGVWRGFWLKSHALHYAYYKKTEFSYVRVTSFTGQIVVY